MKAKLLMGVIALATFLTISGTECKAEIAGDDAFSNLTWEQVYEENVIGSEGVVQSICATEDYIICIENTSDIQDVPDTVSAYYKNNVDQDGNPVEQYSLAKRVQSTNWEHGNGMAYNPNTGEIYVALYTSMNPENRGNIYVMDANTLEYKGKVKISDDYNILGIDYMKDSDQYMIQTDKDGGYSFKILNAEFQIVDDLGEYASTAKGDNFQDLAVSGDYILNFPLTLNMGIGDFLHAYSISRRTMVADPQIDFQFTDIASDEPESLCEVEPGVFLAAVNVINTAGERKVRFYKTEVPYYMDVTVTAENGTISESGKVLRGESFPITYEAAEGYELSSFLVNGEEQLIENNGTGYTINDVRGDTEVQVVFSEIVPAVVDEAEAETVYMKGFVLPSMGSIIVFCGFAMFGGYILYIRAERKRKLSRARELRRQIVWDGYIK